MFYKLESNFLFPVFWVEAETKAETNKTQK